MAIFSRLPLVLGTLIVSLSMLQGACSSRPLFGVQGEFFEDFQQDVLAGDVWTKTRQNDFRQSEINILRLSDDDLRLRLSADTKGTKANSLKFIGVRLLRAIDLTDGKRISFELDWNEQKNGSYLTAGLYLCPTATELNPREEPDWISFKYVGVPPGRNVRFEIVKNTNGLLHPLFTGGWPDYNRIGRKIIGPQHIQVRIDKQSLTVIEDGKQLLYVENHQLSFTTAYLYLQLSSHSNYPGREIFFDNIRVSSLH